MVDPTTSVGTTNGQTWPYNEKPTAHAVIAAQQQKQRLEMDVEALMFETWTDFIPPGSKHISLGWILRTDEAAKAKSKALNSTQRKATKLSPPIDKRNEVQAMSLLTKLCEGNLYCCAIEAMIIFNTK